MDIHISLNRDIYLLRKKKYNTKCFLPRHVFSDNVCNPNPLAGLSQRWHGQVPVTGREQGLVGTGTEEGLETSSKWL